MDGSATAVFVAGGERGRMERDANIREKIGNVEMKEPDFPELTKMQAFDRRMHIEKSIEMGMSREEAEAHADDDMSGRDDAHK